MKVVVCAAIGATMLMMGGTCAIMMASTWAIICLCLSLVLFVIACTQQEKKERRDRSSKYMTKTIRNWEVSR